ncbi:hypothetical protein D3C76_245090 [compost metagenome]|uniref:DUF2508 family protein n=2 Tax=Paenibacillus TaxID=44249 RepID=A0ABS2H9F8_9BACL|nr:MULTISPECIES: DUF2508 family protein [Paenibacillus]MBM6998042.1 DUF2508 family protein [Paenibacillus rhizolycopersici]MUG89068.1 DUF2508 family protein [Paenibacillus timonensis]GIP50893.1 hypothetical protein J53TS2_44840 [Paenibacillus sp. J53TS2]
MKILKRWGEGRLNQARGNEAMDYKRELYAEVINALREWERARIAFQEAVGHDEVDVAIYTLEAAERRYQIQLKAAKQAQVDWDAFRNGSYYGEGS